MEVASIKTGLDNVSQQLSSMKPFDELQKKIARALKKSPTVVFAGAKSFSDYTSIMAKHLIKPSCAKVLADLKETYRGIFPE